MTSTVNVNTKAGFILVSEDTWLRESEIISISEGDSPEGVHVVRIGLSTGGFTDFEGTTAGRVLDQIAAVARERNR